MIEVGKLTYIVPDILPARPKNMRSIFMHINAINIPSPTISTDMRPSFYNTNPLRHLAHFTGDNSPKQTCTNNYDITFHKVEPIPDLFINTLIFSADESVNLARISS